MTFRWTLREVTEILETAEFCTTKDWRLVDLVFAGIEIGKHLFLASPYASEVEFRSDANSITTFSEPNRLSDVRSISNIRSILDSYAQSIRAKQQWQETRDSYQSIEQEAKDYYENGGTDLHHELAKKLAKKYQVSETTAKKKILPIAKEYDRASGFKGVKKYKGVKK